LAGADGHDAYGAWSGDRCIGLASLALDRDGSVHIGVLVEDSWQRRGAGSALVATLVERARARRQPSLVADVLADDHFILRLLARIGPVTTTLAYGEYRARVELDRIR
jgi:GNAT superfamily N-acetyltransferase